VCKWAGLPDPATTSVTVLALGVPPAVELRIKSRRRDTNVDIARIQRGELRRPVGLVVILLAAAIVLLDSAPGIMIWGISPVLSRLEDNTAKVVGGPLLGTTPVIVGMCLESNDANAGFGTGFQCPTKLRAQIDEPCWPQ
jgi:hypothetical protein